MNTINILNTKKLRGLPFLVFFLFPLIFTSCDDTADEPLGERYFNVEGSPTGLSVGIDGATNSYVVRSNRPWKVVTQGEADWVKVFPSEGDDDGIFKIIVDENQTFNARSINFAFVVDGEEQPTLFLVEQEANVPFIIVEDVENGIGVPSVGGEVQIKVSANVDWTYALDGSDWLTELEKSDSGIKFLAKANRGEERSKILTLGSAQYPDLERQVTITQSAGNIILEEDFSWLSYGNMVFYETKDEERMDNWTQEEMDHGWTSTENSFTSNQKVVYARTGFVKLGKTNYGGDLISPKLSMLDGTAKLRVTFKAVPYKTKGGTEDDNILKISALGSGSADISSFTIDNWPDYDSDPNCTAIWENPGTVYQFTITGATSETQIKFLGGEYDLHGIGKGKNRIFIDDIKVVIIE